MRITAISTLLFSLLLGASVAQAGSFSLSYGGRLSGANDEAVKGPVELRVTFWNAKTGGNELTSILKSAVPLEDGVFQVDLDLTDSERSQVFGDGSAAVWVEVKDETSKKTYPRQMLTAVPFALVAKAVPVDGTTIKFNSSGKLEAIPPAGSPASSIGSGTISVSGLAAGQVLTYDGSNWKNSDALSKPIGLGQVATAQESALTGTTHEGKIWYNSNTDEFRINKNGSVETLATKEGAASTYLKKDGSSAMTGSLAMGGFGVENTGNIEMAATKTLKLSNHSSGLAGLSGAPDAGKMWFEGGVIKYYDGSAYQTVGAAGAGILTINSQGGTAHTLATPGTSGNAPGWSSVGGTHTLNIPMASASGSVTAGLISNGELTSLLNKDGSIAMTGNLSMGSHKITNVTDPTSPQDAATMAYVDSGLSGKAASGHTHTGPQVAASLGYTPMNPAGDTMSGNLAMGGNKVTGLGTPGAAGDAATKGYVDAYVPSSIAVNAVATSNLQNGAVTDTKLAADSVTTAKILDGNVTTAKIAAGAVTPGKLDTNGQTVTNAQLGYLAGVTNFIQTQLDNRVVAGGQNSGVNITVGPLDDYGFNITTNNLMRVTVSNHGSVGIGTPAPGAGLHVAAPLATPVSGTVSTTSGSPTVSGTGTSFDTEFGVGDMIRIGGANYTVSSVGGAGSINISPNAGATLSNVPAYRQGHLLKVETAGYVPQFIVDKMGRVGVGLSSPQAKLHVGGSPGTDGIKFPDGSFQTSAPGPTIRFSRGTAPYGDSAATKTTLCQTDLGMNYVAASPFEVALQAMAVGFTSGGIAFNTSDPNYTYKIMSAGMTTTTAGSYVVACVRKGSPIRLSSSTTAIAGTDGTKDSVCVTEFGPTYQAAVGLDVASNMKTPTVPNTNFTVAGSANAQAMSSGYTTGTGGPLPVVCIIR